jgi:hypothetical protein
VISKKIPMRNSRKSSFRGLVRYALDDQQKIERVGEVFIANCQSQQLDWALAEIEAVQEQNQRAVSDKTYHLIVSFQQGEEPAEEVLKAIETEMASALGFGEHQRITVVHRDTDNVHMHMAINKVHPTKLTLHEPFRDHRTLDKACDALEDRFGLTKDNHKYKKTVGQGKAADMESHSGIQSLMTYAQQRVPEAMKQAQSWSEFHGALAASGLELKERGAGFIFKSMNADLAIKASSVGRGYSKKSLIDKFGVFSAASAIDLPPRVEYYAPTPSYKRGKFSKRLDPLFEEYRRNQTGVKALRGSETRELQKQRLAEIRQLKNAARTKRKLLRLADSGALKLITKELIQQKLKADIEEVNQKYIKAKLGISGQGTLESYSKWLIGRAESGNTTAMKRVRKAKKRVALETLYEAERQRLASVPNADFASLQLGFSREKEKLQSVATLKLKILAMSGHSVLHRFAMRSVQKTLMDDIKQLDKKYRKKRTQIYKEKKVITFQEWLRQEAAKGNTDAQGILKQRKPKTTNPLKQHTHMMPAAGVSHAAVICSTAYTTTGGTIVYSVANTSIKDTGDSIAVPSSRTTSTGLEMALRLAAIKYNGEITFSGNATIAATAVKVAVNKDINIKFTDPALHTLQQLYQQRKGLNDDRRTETGRETNPRGNERGRAVYVDSGHGYSSGGRNGRRGHRAATSRGQLIRSGVIRDIALSDGGATRKIPQTTYDLHGVPKRRLAAGQKERPAMLLQSDVRVHLHAPKTESVRDVRRHSSGARRGRLAAFSAKVGATPPDKQYITATDYDDIQDISQREVTAEKPQLKQSKQSPAELYSSARNKLRNENMFDIPKHKGYNLTDTQSLEFAGVRNVAGNHLMLVKLAGESDTVYVKDIDSKTAYRLGRIKLGTIIEITTAGVVKTTSKGRSR